MYFDTTKVAQKIRNARIAKNMTQMNLADAMEVSYQAVSNWERGNSMPDIGRLRQLCGILDISVEELLGGGDGAKTVAKIVNRDEEDPEPVTVDELEEVAPLLPPKETQKLMDETVRHEEKLNIKEIIKLAPFLDREYLDGLVDKVCEVGDIRELTGLAPFLSRRSLDKLVDRVAGTPDIGKLTGLAPFLSREALDKLADRLESSDTGKLTSLAPFLSRATLDKLVDRILAEGGGVNGIIGLCPFLSRETVRKIADTLMRDGKYSELGSIAPFC